MEKDFEGSLSYQEYNTLHETITQNPKTYMKLSDMRKGVVKAIPVTYHGDRTKIVCLKPVDDDSYEIVDVFEANVVDYTGRITELVDLFMKGMKYYGQEGFERGYKRLAEANGFALFRKYNRQSGGFDDIVSEGNNRQYVGSGMGEDQTGRPDGGNSASDYRGVREEAVTLSDSQLSIPTLPSPTLPSPEILDRQIAAWNNRQNRPENNEPSRPQGERQFVRQTMPNTEAVPEWIWREFQNNPDELNFNNPITTLTSGETICTASLPLRPA